MYLMDQHVISPPKKRILFVDDEPMVLSAERRYMQTLVTAAGLQIEEAENGRLAYELMDKDSDCWWFVRTDRTMPKWNGLRLIEAVRTRSPAFPIRPFLLMVSAEDPDLDAWGPERSPDIFVFKSPGVHHLDIMPHLIRFLEAKRPDDLFVR